MSTGNLGGRALVESATVEQAGELVQPRLGGCRDEELFVAARELVDDGADHRDGHHDIEPAVEISGGCG